MSHLALALLGPFQATLDGRSIDGLNSERLRALLAYLAVCHRREHPREALAALLWPERSDAEALSALRFALSNLRSALGDRGASIPFLLVTRTSVQLNPASDYWLDVAEFEELARQPDTASLELAASLYRGPFLHGLSVRESSGFDEWVLLRAEEYQRMALAALGSLSSFNLERQTYAEAARWARQQLELEPYRERAHRQLMMALALSGERPAALAHYEAYRRLLANELGCQPDDETQALHAQLRDGGLTQPWTPSPPFPIIATSGYVPQTAGAHPVRSRSPTESTTDGGAACAPPLVARKQQLAQLHGLLAQALAGEGGVALITGEAGSGKTALLDALARQACRANTNLIALRGRCNAHAGAGDPYLPFREILQTLAGDVESKRAGGTLSTDQAQRIWEALPAVGAALVDHGPELIDTFVLGRPLLRRVEAFAGRARVSPWHAQLREMVARGPFRTVPLSQQDLFTQVTEVLYAVSTNRPLLLTIDDLQWADGGTAALLFHLARRLAGSRILLACTFRPEALAEPPGAERRQDTQRLATVLLELRREWGDVLMDLDQVDGRAFVEAYIDGEPNRLGAAFRQALVRHTEGNPLFTVELLRSFQRDGTLVQDEDGRWVEAAAPNWERWPPQVEAVIAGHLAGLPDEDRALLEAASVQGEQFAAEVAARVLSRDEDAVVQRLSGPLRAYHLVEAVSLERLPSSGQRLSHYRFRHVLLQRGAYGRLDAVARARLNEATARALEAVYSAEGELPQALAPKLARHYEEAGMPLEAARLRLVSGQWATRLGAYEDAVAHLEHGLALLEGAVASPGRLAASHERLRLEMSLVLSLVAPTMLQGGWHAMPYARTLDRLARLVRHPDLRDDPERPAALCALALTAAWSADPARGQRVGEELLTLAQEHPDGNDSLLMMAHWVLGTSCWLRGQPGCAAEHLRRALARYDDQTDRALVAMLGANPAIMAHAMLGFVVWLLGYPDQAQAVLRKAMATAAATAQQSSATFFHTVAGMVHLNLGRDMAAAQVHALALRDLSRSGTYYGAWSEVLAAQVEHEASTVQAGTIILEPKPDQALAHAAAADAALRAMGYGTGYAAQLLVQAQTSAAAHRPEVGLEALDRALAWIERTGARSLEADVWRLRGELLLLNEGGPGSAEDKASARRLEAEACFQRALEIARKQEARWLELRTAVRLAKLWQAHRRVDEARALLQPVYEWFSEGHDTVDMIEARALLAELTPSV